MKMFTMMQGNVGVLIVPLWNWNQAAATPFRLASRFNRTFMELKYIRFSRYLVIIMRFNRTFMELKLNIVNLFSIHNVVF